MRKLFVVLMLLVGILPVIHAQSTAVRFILGEGHKVYSKPAFGNYCMGVGVDRTFNDKLTVGFDVTFDVAGALRAEPKYITVIAGNVQTDYRLSPKLLSLDYHTEYALGENDGTHVYIGTYLGLRHISQKWISDGYLADYNYVSAPVRLNVSKWLIPIGLRMGLRGATDGGFMDLYVAAGYQLGGGKDLTTNGKLKDNPYAKTSALALTIGWAYGMGW
ncbi:MAG: hypothetical protein JST38_11465 [Bacteroidetes bacterium]|nr:hypothetical protein [Bacteroidota bacterium]